MTTRVIWGETDVLERISQLGSCLSLYSGGLDSSYFLFQVSRLPGVRCLPMVADIGGYENVREVVEQARAIVGECHVCEAKEEFAEEFVAPAILANALYNGDFPLSASLSRPHLATLAVRLARQEDLAMVVHTSTILQNSCPRMTRSILRLDDRLEVGMPNLFNETTREHKMKVLGSSRHPNRSLGSASSDVNLWCEETETVEFIDPESSMDPEWVYPPSQQPEAPEAQAVIAFRDGLPYALDGRELPLEALVREVDTLARRYDVGLFSGLEQTPLNTLKRLEVRRCGGAAVLIAAHRALECAALDERTLSTKRFLEQEWVSLISAGDWFSPLKDAIDGFMQSLAKGVTGEVTLRFAAYRFLVSGVRCEDPLYLTAKEEEALSFEGDNAEKRMLAALLFATNEPLRQAGYGVAEPLGAAAETPQLVEKG